MTRFVLLLGLLIAANTGLPDRCSAAATAPVFVADGPNPVVFPVQKAKFVRVVILASSGGQPCIDELEIYGPDGKKNLALAIRYRSPERTLTDATSAVSGIGRHVTNLQGTSSVAVDSTAAARPAQPPAPLAATLSRAVDAVLGLVLDADLGETLIGDLAFEQVSSGAHKPRGSAATGTTS